MTPRSAGEVAIISVNWHWLGKATWPSKEKRQRLDAGADENGIAQAESLDHGPTWVNERPFSTDRGVSTRFFQRKLKSGALLLVVNDTPRGRTHMTAMLSEDDGKTWPHKLLLDERSRVSYPDGTEGSNRFVHITYDRGRYEKGEQEIRFIRLMRAESYVGREV